ncbi:27023_t:CDS:2, partial [Gigaspora margarita]
MDNFVESLKLNYLLCYKDLDFEHSKQNFMRDNPILERYLVIKKYPKDLLKLNKLQVCINWTINNARIEQDISFKDFDITLNIKNSNSSIINNMKELTSYIEQLYHFEDLSVIVYEKVISVSNQDKENTTLLIPKIFKHKVIRIFWQNQYSLLLFVNEQIEITLSDNFKQTVKFENAVDKALKSESLYEKLSKCVVDQYEMIPITTLLKKEMQEQIKSIEANKRIIDCKISIFRLKKYSGMMPYLKFANTFSKNNRTDIKEKRKSIYKPFKILESLTKESVYYLESDNFEFFECIVKD